MVPKRRPPRPHSCKRLRSALRQRAAKKPSQATSRNNATKMVVAVRSRFKEAPSRALILCGALFQHVNCPDADRTHENPGELEPIEEGDAQKLRLDPVRERRPKHHGETDEEQARTTA